MEFDGKQKSFLWGMPKFSRSIMMENMTFLEKKNKLLDDKQ
jgi:hypothetical protein